MNWPEFPRGVLEQLRQPSDEGSLARIMLVAAMNPCPCGFYGDSTRECRCTPGIIRAISPK